MNPDLISILLGVVIKLAETTSQAEQAAALLFIVMAIIVGTVWAVSLVSSLWLVNQARVFFKNA